MKAPPEPRPPTNRLGDWYANLLSTSGTRLIICISERSLLPVFVEARDPSAFIPRFREAVRSVLTGIGVPSSSLDSEACEMAEIAIGATANRRVLSSLNDLAWLARFKLKDHPAIDLATLGIELANTPCGPLKYETPRLVSLALLHRMHS